MNVLKKIAVFVAWTAFYLAIMTACYVLIMVDLYLLAKHLEYRMVFSVILAITIAWHHEAIAVRIKRTVGSIFNKVRG